MRFAVKFADKIVGLFVLIAIIGLLGIVIVLGANQHWFTRNVHFFTIFDSAKGIVRGMPITFKGFEIGRVASFELNDENKVVVQYYIYDTYYPKVYYNSVIELASSPLGSSIIFYPGKRKTDLIAEHSLIPAVNSESGRTIVSQKLAEMPEKSDDALSSILTNVDEITSQINALLKNNAYELDTIVKSLSRVTLALGNAVEGQPGGGPVGQTLVNLNQIVKNLRTLTDDMNGLIPKLLDPTGKEVYPAIQKTLANVEAMSVQLKGFADFISGTAPQISGILDQGRDALVKGKEVLEGLSNNPLLSGGITKDREQPSTFKSFRDEAF